jgi:UDP-N-acetylglucosamine 3-dehydrogenase
MKACVIGIGNMGRHHARIYAENHQIELKGICDYNEETGKSYSEKYNTQFYNNYIEMLDREKPDLVSLVTPTSTHNEIGKEVLNRGIHLLVEKPIADTVRNAEELIKIAERNNLILLVGHIERYNPGVTAIRDKIDKDFFGKISSIQFQRVGVVPPQIKDTNVVIDLAIHDIDLSNYLIGSTPDNVNANLNNTHLKNRFDSCDILMSYKNTSSYIQSNWITPVKIRNIIITGEKGYARLNLISQNIELYETIIETEYDNYGDYIVKFKEPSFSVMEVLEQEPLTLEIDNFINAIKKKEKLRIEPRDALAALSIAIDINNKYIV